VLATESDGVAYVRISPVVIGNVLYTGEHGGYVQEFNATTLAGISYFATPGNSEVTGMTTGNGNLYLTLADGSVDIYSNAGTLLKTENDGIGYVRLGPAYIAPEPTTLALLASTVVLFRRRAKK